MSVTTPTLLFNDECGVCRRIARWVKKSSARDPGTARLVVVPIGDDPDALRRLDPKLGIWDAYATIHLLMPDGTMKLGGEAVAEVFRRLPNTHWFARCFAFSVLGFRPFQMVLNLGYAVLAGTRPIFGCESCGTPAGWLRPFAWIAHAVKVVFGKTPHSRPRRQRTETAGHAHHGVAAAPDAR